MLKGSNKMRGDRETGLFLLQGRRRSYKLLPPTVIRYRIVVGVCICLQTVLIIGQPVQTTTPRIVQNANINVTVSTVDAPTTNNVTAVAATDRLPNNASGTTKLPQTTANAAKRTSQIVSWNATNVSATPDPPCPTNDAWILRGDSCYYFSSVTDKTEGRKSWEGAEQWCNQNGGYLVSIHGTDEQDFVNRQVEISSVDSHWIGVREHEINGVYFWSDGTPFNFDFWADGEPNDYNGEEQCAETYTGDGKWNDINCSINRNFICRKPINSVTPITKPTAPASVGNYPVGTAPPDMPGTCSDDWYPYGSHCYYFQPESQDLVEWPMADFDCVRMGGKLASIHSKSENEFVQSNVKRTESMWIGFYRSNAGGFSWEDGTVVDFVNWVQGKPSWPWDGEHENCVELNLDRGEWNDLDCKNLKSYVCKMPTIPLSGPLGQVTDAPSAIISRVAKKPHKSFRVSAGVIIGIILAILLIFLMVLFLVSCSNKFKAPIDIDAVSFDNAMYSASTGEIKVSDLTTITTKASISESC